MILTITLNPSVDMSYKLTEGFFLDQVNRVEHVSKTAGGKGLNVSRVLKELDEEVAATGFLGGHLGEFIQEELKRNKIHDYFIPIQGSTRNCIAILHEGNQTEILENGPIILKAELQMFLDKIKEYVQRVKNITISGSLPKGVPTHFYSKILTIASEHSVPILLDTKGELLKCCLQNGPKPFLIKPNEEEIADLLDETLTGETDIERALQDPIFNEVSWVIVTLGENGAIIKYDQQIYRVRIPKVDVVNPVGSGDSVIAGFASGISKGLSGVPLMKYSLSMGVLNAMEEKTGHIDSSKLKEIEHQIEIEL